ncbi:MAG: DNA photolyase family protein [Caulobacteraceae bacterium]|nr:DNA photolyase family protein [Caulobacteraceae bacterium]
MSQVRGGTHADGGAPVILWFRRDLRLADNPALDWAAGTGRPVVPVYVHDEALEARRLGAAARWWLHGSLDALDAQLASLGSRLILMSGPSAGALVELAGVTGAGALAFNRLYDPSAREREAAVVEMLPDLEVRSFCAGWLREPGTVLTAQGAPYKVFTPFGKALGASFTPPPPCPPPDRLRAPVTWPGSERLADWGLRPCRPNWASAFEGDPGEPGALSQLEGFARRCLETYPVSRDAPGDPRGTSRLSPHLRFGEIAPWRVWSEVGSGRAAAKFRGELAWRDFAAHLLHHFPRMTVDNMRPAFDRMVWRTDPAGFESWTRGQTGFPIVDAGMRQLWTTGWMHNRVRMIVASFLVKDLMIDWREGEAWFWDCLVDADPANNTMNWQWAAGTGIDAAPYFRVFNPVLQGERFDPDGRYVRRWVPELARLPDRWLHRPAEAPREVLDRAGLVIGRDYPAPIVDHAAARTRALEAFRALK